MSNNNQQLIEASKYYSVTPEGRLSRDSTPYPMDSRAKMGVGIDHVDTKGYLRLNHRPCKFDKFVLIRSHRMIFYIVNGYLPDQVDHIDQNKQNNHPSNLRPATNSQNQMNQKSFKGSSSKYLGVSWEKGVKKWKASISVKGKKINLGRFHSEDDAASIRNLAAIEHFGEFASLNLIGL